MMTMVLMTGNEMGPIRINTLYPLPGDIIWLSDTINSGKQLYVFKMIWKQNINSLKFNILVTLNSYVEMEWYRKHN